MAIPNPNPNIADGIKSDNKTYSSNKIESLISTSQLPEIGEGDEGKVVTVGSDGYELDTPVAPESIIDDSAAASDTVYSSSKVDTLLSGKADASDIPTMGNEVTLSASEPFITYRKYGHTLFLYINTQNQSYTSDTVLGNLPADCTPLMGSRVYRGAGFISCDSENNNRIWARDIDAWTTCTMVLPI